MLKKELFNVKSKELFTITIINKELTLTLKKNGIEKILQRKILTDATEAIKIGDRIIDSILEKVGSWQIDKVPRLTKKTPLKIVEHLEKHILMGTLNQEFKDFIVNEDYIKFNGWGLKDIGGYDNVKVFFKKTIESVKPNPFFTSTYPQNFFLIGKIEEDSIYSDSLFIDFNDKNCAVFSYCHDYEYPERFVKEFDSLKLLKECLISPELLDILRK